MLNKWLLINYAGLPLSPNSLMPDNGLANLAGALLSADKQVEILDYCRVETIERLNTPEMTQELKKIYDVMNRNVRSISIGQKIPMMFHLFYLEGLRGKKQREFLSGISEEIIDKIHRQGVKAVGFKLWNGDGLLGSVYLARQIKRHCPGVRVFGGGPHVDFFMETLLNYGCFDALVYGEGERAICHLAETHGDGKPYVGVPNLIFKEGHKYIRTDPVFIEDLDELPMPQYHPDIYAKLNSDEKIRIFVLDDSRGCKNHCAFCIHPVKSNNVQRVKSIRRLLAELDHLGKLYHARYFRFAGSCTPYSLLNQFAQEVVKRQRPILYTSFAHVRNHEEADYTFLHRSGCVSLFFGIESGSQRILDLMHKGTTVEMILGTLKAAKAAGIYIIGSLIYPAPGEDERTEEETMELLLRGQLDAAPIQPPVITPRTLWYDQPKKYFICIPNRKKYDEVLRSWKVKALLPPFLWNDLPLTINGETYKNVINRTAMFIKRVEAKGITTSISDETYLMGRALGRDINEFKNEMQRAFFSGDAQTIKETVSALNTKITESVMV